MRIDEEDIQRIVVRRYADDGPTGLYRTGSEVIEVRAYEGVYDSGFNIGKAEGRNEGRARVSTLIFACGALAFLTFLSWLTLMIVLVGLRDLGCVALS